jgi:hypothetical protein
MIPIWVRYRWVLLALIIVSWGIGFLAISREWALPESSRSAVVAVAAIVFVWSNGLFWLLEIFYPHIEGAEGEYYSRISEASHLMTIYGKLFFGFYFCGALAVTFVCARLLYAG